MKSNSWMRVVTALAIVFLAAGTALAAPASTSRDTPSTDQATFYGDVLPILQTNCQMCHRPAGANFGGMIAPMSLMDYKDTRPWARSIARVVSEREMPPWHAAPEFHGVFANERTLSEADIDTLVRWARSGARAGEESEAPPSVEFPEGGWAIGDPDLVVEMPEVYTVGDEIEDQYVNFTAGLGLTEARWVRAIEFKPGSEAVHHIIGYAMAPGEAFGAGERGMIGGIAPGNDPDTFPEGYGFRLEAGSKLVFAMHYHKEKGPGTAIPDLSSVGFKFYPKGEEPKQIYIQAVGNGQFEIPPGHPNWQVGAAQIFDRPVEVLYLMPHLHLRGKAARYVAYYPDGTSKTLLDVPAYDFNWQTSYDFREPEILPAGTRLEVSLWYDNTPQRAAEANFNWQRAVRFGGPTTDEMDLGWLSYAFMDEN